MINAKKSLGQNFLVDLNIIKKIISTTNITNKNVVEIGPGTGNLTKNILQKKPKNLILIEKDKELVIDIKKKFEKESNIEIFNTDVLKFNWEKDIKAKSIIFGNLPYNISTQILVNLIRLEIWPPKYERLILMFQKEVAEKILSTYNSKNYGRIGIISNLRLEIEDHFHISPNCFLPKPKVQSTLLIFKPISKNENRFKNVENLEKITHLFFSNKRKMINKVFKKLFANYESVAKKLDIDLTMRPSELSSEKYFQITELYEKLK